MLQICDGASPEERTRWKLKPANEFHYLNQSSCYEIPGDSNAEEFSVSVLLQHSPCSVRVSCTLLLVSTAPLGWGWCCSWV